MLDELIFSFNSSNGPFMQVLKRSSLILESSIFYLQSYNHLSSKSTSSLILSISNGEKELREEI